MITQVFIPTLLLEVGRIRREEPEVSFAFPCHKRVLKNRAPADRRCAHSGEMESSIEKRVLGFLRHTYVPALTSFVGRVTVSTIAMVFLGFCCYTISVKTVGYAPAELFEPSDPANRALELTFTKFSLFGNNLCFYNHDGVSFDVAGKQGEMLALFRDLTAHNLGAESVTANFLTLWYGLLYLKTMASTGGNETLLVPALESVGFSQVRSVFADPDYEHKHLMPFGPLLQDRPEAFYKLFNSHRRIPPPLLAYDPSAHPGLYNSMDGGLVNEFSYENSSGYEKPTFVFMIYYGVNLETEDIFVQAIKEHQAIVDASPLRDQAFIFGPIFVYWQVFLGLDLQFALLLSVATLTIFFAALLVFNCDFLAAGVTCVSCLMIIVEVYGLSTWLMNFNVFVASIALAGVGLSVEFTAHLAAAYSLSTGSSEGRLPPDERLARAVSHTFPALVEGGLSTFATILPLAFHPTLFTVKYLFGVIAMIVGVGLLNGLLFMPALLSLFSPISDAISSCSSASHATQAEQESTPAAATAEAMKPDEVKV